ncbi:sulfite exporter TauE/SafE family protein [Clostridium sp.]|uniref:sulfite exporter TauE/SafE family protein n=1 Tax=Clostridium sp. TaxID=1506 RepID=UPI003A5B9898
MDIYVIILSILIIFFASCVQGAVGFAYALIAVPLLSFILPMKIIVPIIVISSFINNIIVAYSTRDFIDIGRIWLMILFGVLGIPLGVYALTTINPELLKLIVGILILINSILMIKGHTVKFKRVKLAYRVGFISGVLNGSVSISGPPIALFLNNEGYGKDEFRASFALYGIIANTLTIITFGFDGLLSKDMFSVLAINIVPLLLGSFLGLFISNKISNEYFKKIVLFLLVIISIVTIIDSLMLI